MRYTRKHICDGKNAQFEKSIKKLNDWVESIPTFVDEMYKELDKVDRMDKKDKRYEQLLNDIKDLEESKNSFSATIDAATKGEF